LCLTGHAAWGRLSERTPNLRVALFLREHADAWRVLRAPEHTGTDAIEAQLDPDARRVLDALRTGGASFLRDIARNCGPTEAAAAHAIAALTVAGLVTCDV